jgi:hypothetical protein
LSGTRLEFAPSWVLAALIVVLHSAAAASVFVAMDGWAGTALAVALVLLGITAAWARALHRSRASVRALVISGSEIALELGSGERVAVELAPRRHVGRFMVTLGVRRPMRRAILVTADMLEPEEFRRLRLWALWGRVPVAAKQLSA